MFLTSLFSSWALSPLCLSSHSTIEAPVEHVHPSLLGGSCALAAGGSNLHSGYAGVPPALGQGSVSEWLWDVTSHDSSSGTDVLTNNISERCGLSSSCCWELSVPLPRLTSVLSESGGWILSGGSSNNKKLGDVSADSCWCLKAVIFTLKLVILKIREAQAHVSD